MEGEWKRAAIVYIMVGRSGIKRVNPEINRPGFGPLQAFSSSLKALVGTKCKCGILLFAYAPKPKNTRLSNLDKVSSAPVLNVFLGSLSFVSNDPFTGDGLAPRSK